MKRAQKFLTLVLPPAWAAIACFPAMSAMGPVSLAHLTAESELIVIAEVERTERVVPTVKPDLIGEARDQQIPMGVAWVSVNTWIKGERPDPVLRVFYVPVIEDSPVFEVGQRMLLFLASNSEGAYETVAMSQGQYLIEDGLVKGSDAPLAGVVEEIKRLLD